MRRSLIASAGALLLATAFRGNVVADGGDSGYHVVDPWIRPIIVTAHSNASGASVDAQVTAGNPSPHDIPVAPGTVISRQAVAASPGVQVAQLRVGDPSTKTLSAGVNEQPSFAGASGALTNRVVQNTVTIDGKRVQLSLVLFSPTGGVAFGGLGTGALGVRPVSNTPLIIVQQQLVPGPISAQPSAPPDMSIPAAPIRVDPKSLAQDLRAHIGLPAVQISIAPDIGLVGLPDFAWLSGYGGQDLVASRTVDIPPVVGPNIPLILVPANDPRRQGQSFTVSVKLTPTGYTWDFGDGSQAVTTTSLGSPYPQRSAIQHTYQRSSLGQPGGVAIAVTAHFAASYQVDSGGWQSLPPVDHTYRRTQVVQQVQTVLVAGH